MALRFLEISLRTIISKNVIHNVAIAQSLRSQGYGTCLIQMIMQGARAANIDFIELFATQESKKFYTKKIAFNEKTPGSLTMIKYIGTHAGAGKHGTTSPP